MSKLDAAIAGSDYITVTIDGETFSLTESHPNYKKARDALKARDADLLSTLVDIPKAISSFSGGTVVVEGGEVKFLGKAIHTGLTRRMLEMMKEGFDIEPMANFLNNIQANPSFRAVQELYGFLEVCKLPITDDGYFLAYKRVRENFTDIHSGTFDNSPGSFCSMPRNEVNENKDETCSDGLHFCSIEYLPKFGRMVGKKGDHVVIVKINPADVVAIPSDYNNAKGRTCCYEVVDVWMDWETFIERNEEFFVKPVVDTYTPPAPKGHSLLSLDDAAKVLCGHTLNPKSALKKRINRGSVKSEIVTDGSAQRLKYYVDTATIEKYNQTAINKVKPFSPEDTTVDYDDMTQEDKENTRAWKNGYSDGITAATYDFDDPHGALINHLTDEQCQNPGNYTDGFSVGYKNYTAELVGRRDKALNAKEATVDNSSDVFEPDFDCEGDVSFTPELPNDGGYSLRTNLGTNVNVADHAPIAQPLTEDEESTMDEWKNGYEHGLQAAKMDIEENNIFQKGKHVRPSDNTLYTRGFHKGYQEAYDSWLKGAPSHVRTAYDAKIEKHESTSWTKGIVDGMLDGQSEKALRRVKNSYKRPPDDIKRKDYYVEAFKLAYERTWDSPKWNWFDGDR